jgi:hypothetical protein
MKRLVLGLIVMVVIAGAAVLMVMQMHNTAYSAKVESQAAPATKVKSMAKPSSGSLSGKVLETMDSGGYTYVLLETAAGKKWVAAPKTVVTVGQSASFAPGMVMRNFKSETLNRTFDEVVFSSGKAGAVNHSGMPASAGACPGTAGKDGKSSSAGMKMGSMAGGMGAMQSPGRVVVPPVDLVIEKAAGANAFTVAEIYAQGPKLNQKKVVVRGKVVKVSSNIMGKNWIHLQDGTGKPEAGTHDLVLTSQQQPKVGEILVAEGVLAADKDFGAGYRYKVIVEETEFK